MRAVTYAKILDKNSTTEIAFAHGYHKIDTWQMKTTVVRDAVDLVPPDSFYIIPQNSRFVNSQNCTIFCLNFRAKRYTLEKIIENFLFFVDF